MKLVPTDIDHPTGMWKLPALDRGRDTLIGGADQDQKKNDDAGGDEQAANGARHGVAQDSVSARPYFSIRE
jgi:hypothetical protein